ncbi:MAG: DUF4332 domain-containing protein [Bacteroidota bacterium]
MARKNTNSSTIQKGYDTVKTGISDLHDDVLLTADKMVDISLESAAKWQKLGVKTINKGTALLDRQQDIAFDALEEVKSQYITGSKRFIKLFGLNKTKAKKAAKMVKNAPKAAKKAAKTVAQAPKAAVEAAELKVAKAKQELAQDDIKTINGIGPKVAELLDHAGIKSFEVLAKTSVEKLEGILAKAGSSFKTMDPAPWIAEAKKLAKK